MSFFVGSPIFVGGLVGFNNGGTIQNSYSKLDVRTDNFVTKASGGLVGIDVGGKIDCCYATGSVINRYIIGGIIGIVTDKNMLLGYDKTTENAIRNDSERIFASNYEYDFVNETNIENDEQRGAYISGNIDPTLNEINEEALDRSSVNKLSITNTIASNKWLQNADNDYFKTTNSGLFIGSIISHSLDTNDRIKHTFNISDYVIIDEAISFKIFENNNYINMQALLGSSSTITTFKLTEILRSIINDVENEDDKAEILDKINSASLGATNNAIIQSFEGKNLNKLATCIVNNVLFSFENILKIDDIMLRKDLFVRYLDYYGTEITDEDYEALAGGSLLYVKSGNSGDESDFQRVSEVESSAYKSAPSIETYESFVRNIGELYVKIEENNYRNAQKDDYFVEANSSSINLENSQNIFIKVGKEYYQLSQIIKNIEVEISSDNKYYFQAGSIDNYFEEFKKNGCLFEKKNGVFQPLSDDQTYYVRYEDGLNETKLNSDLVNSVYIQSSDGQEYYQLNKLLVKNNGVQHRVQDGKNFVAIRITNESMFNTLKSNLYRIYADNKLYKIDANETYFGEEKLYLNYDNESINYYKLETSEMYVGINYFEKNNDITFYTLGDYYIRVIGLYGNYNEKYFILPNKDISTTRFYPELIVNINEYN